MEAYTHMLFMLQAIEYLLLKVTDLYRLQAEQQQQALRKKPSIRVFDRSLERLPPHYTPALNITHSFGKDELLPALESSQSIMQQISSHRQALEGFLENAAKSEPIAQREMRILKERVSTLEFEVKHLSCDVGELISLYKECVMG